MLHLSRTIHFPWSQDVGTMYILASGGYRVFRFSTKTNLGETQTLQEAVDLIAATLPEGCGPAIDGTANDL
jgi:hypothetical protein